MQIARGARPPPTEMCSNTTHTCSTTQTATHKSSLLISSIISEVESRNSHYKHSLICSLEATGWCDVVCDVGVDEVLVKQFGGWWDGFMVGYSVVGSESNRVKCVKLAVSDPTPVFHSFSVPTALTSPFPQFATHFSSIFQTEAPFSLC